MKDFIEQLRQGDKFTWGVAVFIACQFVVVVCNVAIIVIKVAE